MSRFNPLPLQALAGGAGDLQQVRKPPVVSAQGRLAIYVDRIRFEVPATIANAFGVTEGTPVGIFTSRSSPEIWTITPRVGRKRSTLHYSKYTKQYEFDALSPTLRYPADTPCGLSPTEYSIEDGIILIRCPIKTRKPLAANAGKQMTRRRRATAVKEQVETAVLELLGDVSDPAVVKAPAAIPILVSDVDTIRAALDAVRHIEATTPYRLGRRTSTGAWCFSAPRIE